MSDILDLREGDTPIERVKVQYCTVGLPSAPSVPSIRLEHYADARVDETRVVDGVTWHVVKVEDDTTVWWGKGYGGKAQVCCPPLPPRDESYGKKPGTPVWVPVLFPGQSVNRIARNPINSPFLRMPFGKYGPVETEEDHGLSVVRQVLKVLGAQLLVDWDRLKVKCEGCGIEVTDGALCQWYRLGLGRSPDDSDWKALATGLANTARAVSRQSEQQHHDRLLNKVLDMDDDVLVDEITMRSLCEHFPREMDVMARAYCSRIGRLSQDAKRGIITARSVKNVLRNK